MRLNLTLILIVVGVSWGLTAPLSKIAVSTGHHYLGLLIWQIIVMVLSLGIVQAIRRKYFISLSVNSFLRFGLVALMGSLLPNSIMYKTYFHLQSGVMSILIAMVPMFAFPLVLVLRMENLEFKRLLGVLLGAIAIALLILPQLNLTNMGQSGWIAFGLLSPLCYAIEGVWINKIGLAKLDPVELVLGSSIIGLIVSASSHIAKWILDITSCYLGPCRDCANDLISDSFTNLRFIYLVDWTCWRDICKSNFIYMHC